MATASLPLRSTEDDVPARRPAAQRPLAADVPVAARDVASRAVDTRDLAEVERFRYALRRFMRASEQAAYRQGLTPQQHQLLLALKGFPGRDYANISELADRLQACPHGVVGLVDRLERSGLVLRRRGQSDRRQVFIHLTPAGEETLTRLSYEHLRELANMRALVERAPVPTPAQRSPR